MSNSVRDDIKSLALQLHADNKGKWSMRSKVEINTLEDLSKAYSPGVAEPCKRIAENPSDAYLYTSKGNTVAVITDGSAVLGLGNIGALAALPVMEGKAILFKEFGDVDAVPICLNTQDDEEIIKTVQLLAPAYGGINLEDIEAPRCFAIEKRLKETLDIPVFHDDQHGTAICTLAALINAAKVVNKPLTELKVVINGIGAAGNAIANILLDAGVKNITLVDRNGIINRNNPQTMLNDSHRALAELTNNENRNGFLPAAVIGADAFIGVSKPGLLTKEMVRTMSPNSIIFAMANPDPEILPDEAKAGGAAIVGTGRSDFPNQINNVLVFPGIFKGALAARATDITNEMKLATAYALANYIPESELDAKNIIPSALDKNVAQVVANAVIEIAKGEVAHERTPITQNYERC